MNNQQIADTKYLIETGCNTEGKLILKSAMNKLVTERAVTIARLVATKVAILFSKRDIDISSMTGTCIAGNWVSSKQTAVIDQCETPLRI